MAQESLGHRLLDRMLCTELIILRSLLARLWQMVLLLALATTYFGTVLALAPEEFLIRVFHDDCVVAERAFLEVVEAGGLEVAAGTNAVVQLESGRFEDTVEDAFAEDHVARRAARAEVSPVHDENAGTTPQSRRRRTSCI